MSIVAVGITAAATVGAAAISSNAASDAAETQANAARDASNTSLQASRETNELNKQIYEQNRADAEPWRTAGVSALSGLANYKAPAQTLPDSGTFSNTNFGDTQSSYANARINDASVPDVGAWFTSALGRQADAEGQAYWESRLSGGEDPDAVYNEFLSSAKANGETINPDARTWRQTAKSAYADARFSDTDAAFANARLADPDSAYANTDIGSKLSEYRNPDFGLEGFSSTNLKDTDSAYANPQLRNLLANFSRADFEADPGYEYRLEQGGRAVENSAAARGAQLSGATLKALARFGQNEGAAEYDRAFNRFRTQKLDQYGQSVDDYGRTEGQRREKYGQRMDEYGLSDAQRAAKYGIATDQYNRADAQRRDQYGQRIDKFGRDETQRRDKYGQRVDDFGRLEGQRRERYGQRIDEFGRLEGQRVDQYGQRVDEFGRLEGQRENQYGQRTDQYNRDENQRINRYGIATDQYNRGVASESRDYNRLAELAGIGQRVNETNAAGGRAYAQQVSANTNNAAQQSGLYRMAAGDAQASGAIGRANALNRGLNTAYGLYQIYNNTGSRSTGGTGGWYGSNEDAGSDWSRGYF